MLAGLVTKPERHDVSKCSRAFGAPAPGHQEHDRGLIERAGLPPAAALQGLCPLWLERAESRRCETPRVVQERNCYVCKKSFSSCIDTTIPVRKPAASSTMPSASRPRTERPLRPHYRRRGQIGFQASLKLLAPARMSSSPRAFPSMPSNAIPGVDFSAFRERLKIHASIFATPERRACLAVPHRSDCRGSTTFEQCLPTGAAPAGFFQHLLEREAQPLAALPEPARGCAA